MTWSRALFFVVLMLASFAGTLWLCSDSDHPSEMVREYSRTPSSEGRHFDDRHAVRVAVAKRPTPRKATAYATRPALPGSERSEYEDANLDDPAGMSALRQGIAWSMRGEGILANLASCLRKAPPIQFRVELEIVSNNETVEVRAALLDNFGGVVEPPIANCARRALDAAVGLNLPIPAGASRNYSGPIDIWVVPHGSRSRGR